MHSPPVDPKLEQNHAIREFELPRRISALASLMTTELFLPISNRRELEWRKFQLLKKEEEENLEEITSDAESLISEFEEVYASAELHLKNQSITIKNNSAPNTEIENCRPEQTLKRCEDLRDQLLHKKKPSILIRRPDGSCSWEANIVWVIMLGILSIWFWYIVVGFVLLLVVIKKIVHTGILDDITRLRGLTLRMTKQIKDVIHKAETDAEKAIEQAKTGYLEEMNKVEAQYLPLAEAIKRKVEIAWQECKHAGAEWSSPEWKNWAPDPSPEFASRIGVLRSKQKFRNFEFTLPALVPFSDGRCLGFKASSNEKQKASGALLGVVVRVLANTPPGKARFTFIDPVGLGQNVADFLHLGDFHKDLISGKAWSEPQQIEQQLVLLTEHMEVVIQTCLRKEFKSILEYNQARNEVAQPFRFLIINDFPVNFTEASTRRLVSIIKNGPRCGVFTFLLVDTEKKLPYGITLDDFSPETAWINLKKDESTDHKSCFVWEDHSFKDFELLVDDAPPQELTSFIVKKSGEMAIPAMKIEVPFDHLLKTASLTKDFWWTASSAESLRVPIGPCGSRAIQELVLGGDQEAHALLVGRTGSGKTNLMHVIITGLALKYPADELQLYLIDFKGGVGFKRYAEYKTPHAKVIAIESEREFGMSVLRGLDAELKRRSDIFRSAGVDNLFAYRSKMRTQANENFPMSRILLIVDEFQEFFSENDDLAQQAKMIFERLARQGRSFGVHFLLATQSLSGSAQLPSSIMGQIKVRIALPCSEADSRLILADDNKAARALSLPGEGIYNPLAGLVEGNNRFQVARFSDEDLPKYLALIGETSGYKQLPLVFEGNELAILEECAPLKDQIQATTWDEANKNIEIALGEPIAIMPPVTARFRRQSGSNLLIVCRDEGEGLGMCVAAFLGILAQRGPDKRTIYLADFIAADTDWAQHAEEIARCFPGEATIVRRQRDVTGLVVEVAKTVQDRAQENSDRKSIFLILQGIHRIKVLREDMEDDDGNNAVELLKTILKDGPEVGVHVIAWGDTYGNVTRGLDRRSLGEFGLRVAGLMDAGDSMNFLDNMSASKLSKPHRALFYDEDKPGQFLTFRPYKLPTLAWLQDTRERLLRRAENEKSSKL
jgi:hypothetical protein